MFPLQSQEDEFDMKKSLFSICRYIEFRFKTKEEAMEASEKLKSVREDLKVKHCEPKDITSMYG